MTQKNLEVEYPHENIRYAEICQHAYEITKQYSFLLENDTDSKKHLKQIVASDSIPKNAAERVCLYQLAVDELFNFGPLSLIMRDTSVREIQVFASGKILVNLDLSNWSPTQLRFQNLDHVKDIAHRLFQLNCVDDQSPFIETVQDNFWIALSNELPSNKPILVIQRIEEPKESA